MSAIAGLVYFDGRVDREGILAAMLDRMPRRGLDGRGEIAMGPASFGHWLLHTTEESLREKLPERDGSILLTAATRLDPGGARDSAVLWEAVRKRGREFAAELEGDFAVAIYDDAARTVLLARDHFGIKPLYYYHAPGRFLIFASEIRALFAHPEVPRRVHKRRLAQLWLGQNPNQADSFYEAIYRVPAAHTMSVSAAGLKLRRYWALDAEREIRLGSEDEYAEAFRELFTRAVKTRLRTPFKVGFQLSGGLDSSAVTCVGRDILRTANRLPAATYSDIFSKTTSADERPLIESVLAQGGFEAHFVDADESSPLSELDFFLDYDDEGSFNTNSNLVFLLHRKMHADGVRICLDGFDGDTTVGHGRFLLAEQARDKNWTAFDRELAAFCTLQKRDPAKLASIFGGPALTQLLRDGKFAEYFRSVREAAPHFHRTPARVLFETAIRPCFGVKEMAGAVSFLNGLVDPALARSMGLAGCAREFLGENRTHFLSERELQVRLFNDGAFAFGLERFDYLAGHFQMENRHPFMDRGLVEFCVAAPSSVKLKDGYTRWMMRRGLGGSLPEKVVRRAEKADFTEAFRNGLLKRDRARVEGWIFHAKELRNWLQMPALHEALADAVEGRLPDAHLFVLFRVLTSAAWLRHSGLELR